MSVTDIREAMAKAKVFTPDDEALLQELARLDSIAYDRRREQAAKQLGVRMSSLDAEVARRRGKTPVDSLAQHMRWDLAPWPAEVDGHRLVDDLNATLRRHIVLPDGASETIALFVMHAWCLDAADISPILVLNSPEKRCGKTTVLSLLAHLVPRPLPTSNVTAAALYRSVEKWCPTLLIDEADSFFGGRDELRGVVNSGHRRDTAVILRTVGDDFEPKLFKTWAPKAIAVIGHLHDTLWDRAIVIALRRKRIDEPIERIKRAHETYFMRLRRSALRWADDHIERLRERDPVIPSGLNDRSIDNWRPFLAIADEIGGPWPEIARRIVFQVSGEPDADAGSTRTLLLADIRDLFERTGDTRISSAKLIEHLVGLEERPWGEWRQGQPMSPPQLARLLKPFRIAPKTLRFGEGTIGSTSPAGMRSARVRRANGRVIESRRRSGRSPTIIRWAATRMKRAPAMARRSPSSACGARW